MFIVRRCEVLSSRVRLANRSAPAYGDRFLNASIPKVGAVFFWNNRNLYLGPGFETCLHAPHCVKLCIATRGAFKVWLPGEGWKTRQVALIHTGQLHQLNCAGSTVAIIRRTPNTLAAHNLISAFDSGRDADIQKVVEEFRPRFQTHIDEGCSVQAALVLCDEIEEELRKICSTKFVFDPRIELLLKFLETIEGANLSLAEGSALTKLSPSRLTHLFKQQVGLPFGRYVLGLRLKAALQGLSSGSTLTDVAYRAGFADAAHLSRTSRLILGRTPTSLRTHSWSIRNLPAEQ